MTPKEKAKELVSEMCLLDCRDENIIIAKQCALICVDKILNSHYRVFVGVLPSIDKYWQEVKEEINKL